MPLRTDSLDLGRLQLSPGEGRRLQLHVAFDAFAFGGQRYSVDPDVAAVQLDVSGMTGGGYALRVSFAAELVGPCMRCLEGAERRVDVDSREVDQPGEVEELDSPYVSEQVLDLHAWARDALALALPTKLLCRAGCAGLCADCGANLNQAGADHVHERPRDPRWAKLRELKLD